MRVRLADTATNLAADQRGGVLVLVALAMPVLILFIMLVVDVGHWFEHKRHLQLQADAAALAGGGGFVIPCSDGPIETLARNYAGDPGSGLYNFQVPPTDPANIHVLINSADYWNDGGTDNSDGGPPCAARMVDIKITEANLPYFFGLDLVPAINAHARVEIQQKVGGAGTLPVGVPDSNPASAAAIFVNESTGGVVAVQSLSEVGSATLNGVTLGQWSGSPVTVNVASPGTGVVVALSGRTGWAPSGTLAEICNQVLVECYAGGGAGPWTGLDYIHGYPTTGTGTAAAPLLRGVVLYNVGCADDSGPYFLLNAGCSVGVKAQIDFGVPGDNAALNARVKVTGWGCPTSGPSPKGCHMVYNAAGPNAGYWTTDGANGYPIMPADGSAHPIDLNFARVVGGRDTDGTFTSVQRSFSASTTTAGPVEYVSVSEIGPGANSLVYGTHDLSVTIGVKASLQANATSVSDPVVHLKVAGGTGQTQALDCDPDVNTLRDELGYGCGPQYVKNTGQACPDPNDALWNDPTTQPWNCTRIDTGNRAGQVNQGMLIRTQDGSNSCVNPNNWSQFDSGLPAGDPRIIPVFLVPFGSFGGSGSATVPVTGFATFYITGWSQGNGGQQGDPCPNSDPVNGGGEIVGHFIKYIETINTGGGGALCDFDAFGTCVAVLTE
jgi:hypothetical protein